MIWLLVERSFDGNWVCTLEKGPGMTYEIQGIADNPLQAVSRALTIAKENGIDIEQLCPVPVEVK